MTEKDINKRMPSPPATYRSSVTDVTPASVISAYGTPKSGRTPRSPRSQTVEFLALEVKSGDLAFAEKCRREKSAPSVALERTVSAALIKEVFSAARHGNKEKVEEALEKGRGFDVNYRDDFGNTLFIVACQNGQKRIGKLVLDKGADLNMQNLKGNSGLHFLFSFGYAEIAEYFIALGANPDLKNELGLTCREGVMPARK